MSDAEHVVLIHGSWSRGEQWTAAREAFEDRGYTVHTPTLRHHELPRDEGASRIATLSLRDYVDDLVTLVAGLDRAPLVVGHSLGGLLAQLVAARVDHAGLIAACPSPVGSAGLNTTTMAISAPYVLPFRPWTKPVRPPTWKRFRHSVAHRLDESQARAAYADLVCESGRVTFFELAAPWLDRAGSAKVDYAAISGPSLVIGGESDRIVTPRTARRAASLLRGATYVEIPGADHMVFAGDALPVTMARIDEWIAEHRLFT